MTTFAIVLCYIFDEVRKSDCHVNPISYFSVDKLLSSEDGGGIFDDPPAITESVMMPPDHGDDEDDFDNLQSRK